MNKKRDLLIVFAKNLELGKVKTRLAKSIGAAKALEIYTYLLKYTEELSSQLDADRAIFYSKWIEAEESRVFKHPDIQQYVQKGEDLGERMYQAIAWGLGQGYERVALIGSDCYELELKDLEEAFEALGEHDFVIGPAEDGGYYLIGSSSLNKAVFEDKEWSTDQVFSSAIQSLEEVNSSYHVLTKHSDIDYLEDLPSILKDQFLK